MARTENTKELTYLWSAIFILIGIVLIVLGKFLEINITWKNILEYVGITFVSVFSVSLIYQLFVAKKQFNEFNYLLTSELKEMDAIQSKCMKLGIHDIYESRNTFESKYPLMNIIEQSPEKGKIICVGRSLFHLLNKTAELKKGLEKGLIFELAMSDPEKITPSFEKVSSSYKSDIDSSLKALTDILEWALKVKAQGAIELRYHSAELPDSVLIYTMQDNIEKLIWDLSFGRDLNQKKVMVLDTCYPLGKDLKSRYLIIYQNAVIKVKYCEGQIKHGSKNLND
jgi:hypothetical protein